MHEISLLEQVIKTILGELQAKGVMEPGQIQAVSFEVGALELHSEDSFRQAFQTLSKGTLLEGAQLDLIVKAPSVQCFVCGHKGEYTDGVVDHHDPMPCAPCPKCGELNPLSGGRGVDHIQLSIGKVTV